jgi:hypothetical protein
MTIGRYEGQRQTLDKVPGIRPGTAITHRAGSFPLTHFPFAFLCPLSIPLRVRVHDPKRNPKLR